MSVTLSHPQHPTAAPRSAGPIHDRSPVRPERGTAAGTAAATVRSRLLKVWWWLGRLVRWFAADPQRVRAAATGLLVCALTGALVGVGIGFAADLVAEVVQSVVLGP